MKTCSKCHCDKPATAVFFGKDASKKDCLHTQCKQCLAGYRLANRDRINAKVLELTRANKERYLVKQVAWREAHRAEAAERTRQWNAAKGQDPAFKAARAQYTQQWRKHNSPKNIAKSREYSLRRERRIPSWASEDDLWVIEEASALARLREQMLGGAWHVDHVIPLKGRVVSGFHLPDNIQVVPAEYNIQKGCSFSIDAGPVRFFG